MTAMPPPLANGHDEHAPALYNTEAEQALLGSLLIDNSRFGQVAGFLSAELQKSEQTGT
jgi:DnaB-like helicase N terminal domain